MRRFPLALLVLLFACAAAAEGPKTAGGFGTTAEELLKAQKAAKPAASAKAKPARSVPQGVSGTSSRNSTKPPRHGTIMPQPWIPIPANGKIMTEVCLTDDDLLGVIKRATAVLAKSTKGEKSPENKPENEAASSTGAATLQIGFELKDVAAVVQGLRAIRFVVIRCSGDKTAEQIAAEFDSKLDGNRWRRVASDLGLFGGSAAFYMDTKDGDIMGFGYNPDNKMIYAGHVVGSIDLAKLMGFIKLSPQ